MESAESIRILVAEDEPDMASMLKRLLERKFSATVEISEDCASAREKFESQAFDIITLDYQFPDRNGLELLKEINEMDNPPPVIMVTGRGDEQTAVESYKLGASGYVVKDKRLPALLPNAVEYALSKVALERAERALRESEEQYRTIVENSHDLIWILDSDGRFTFVNPPKTNFRGWYEVTDLTGVHFSRQVHPDDLPRIQKVFEETLAGKPQTYETRAYDEEGKTMVLSVNTVPLYSGDTVVGTLSFGRDITDLKRAEEELARINVELKGYAHTVSHDLKGPLSSIMLGVDMLVESLEGIDTGGIEKTSEIVAIIGRNAENAQNRVDDLLYLAEAGQVPRDVSPVDVREVVEEVLHEKSEEIREKGIEVNLPPDLGTVTGDPVQINQVFSNLIGNAIKYNDCENPVIQISYLGDEDDGSHRYLVRDNGPGIPEDIIDDVFLPFTKGESGDTGIGLSIVEKVVIAYRGEIRARNEGGACFEFTLRDFQE